MTNDYKTVQYAEAQSIASITLNRPDKRNAISYELIDDLIAALKQAANSSAQIVILTGAGKAFCSGMDLDNLKQLTGRTHEQNVQDSETMASLFRALYDFPKPTIAAVNGAAIAGGTGLATLCDFTLAVPEAKFGYTEVRIGFVPGIVSSYLIANVGEKRARDLLLTGRLFDAEEAYKLGLVTEIVPPEQLMPRALQLAAQLMENSPASLRTTKALLSSYTKEQLDRQLKSAIKENAGIRQTADFKEGITSFLEKRKPTWTKEIEDANKKISGETKLRVRYAETDQMGVVYHSNFVIWFEVGRVELLRQLGFQYSDMEQQDDCHIPVVDLRVRYKVPAQYDEEIVIRTEIRNVRSSLLHFTYEVFRESDRTLLATGETMHIIVDKQLKRRPLPEKYLQAFTSRTSARTTNS